MICSCEICRRNEGVSDDELREVVAAFMNKPRCSIQGKAAQAAVAALCMREIDVCPMCKVKMTVRRRCNNSNCEYTG